MADVMTVLLVAALGVGAVTTALLLTGAPGRVLAAWLAVVALVPYWAGPSVGAFVPAITLLSFVAYLALAVRGGEPLSWRDLLVLGFGASTVAAGLVGLSELSDAAVVVAQWVLTFLLGRQLGRLSTTALSRSFALFGVFLAAAAVAELAFRWHPFTALVVENRPYLIWSPIQLRGGLPRSEWTAGHSIALGNIIAMTVPFVFTSRLSAWRTALAVALCFAGIATTFSRSAAVAAGLALVASLVLLARERGLRFKVPVLAAASLAVAAAAPLALFVQGTAGRELSASTAVRFRMFELLPSLRPFGSAGNAVATVDGRIGFSSDRGVFRTLDNTYLYAGLQFGWVPALVLMTFALSLLLLLVRHSRSPAVVAVCSQVPTTFTVAMITQYSAMFWLLAGIAVVHAAAGAHRRRAATAAAPGVGDPVPDGPAPGGRPGRASRPSAAAGSSRRGRSHVLG